MSWYRDKYLKSEDWKNLRQAILHAAQHQCELCGSTGADVHHLRYRKIWDVNPGDLSVLCRSCHKSVHAGTAKVPKHRKWVVQWRINKLIASGSKHPNVLRGIESLTSRL